jgi:hypothetical protein
MTDPDRTTGPDPDEPRPWEQPGAVRKDVAPHRGQLLRALANVSLTCGVAGLVLGVPAVLALPLGITTCVLANRDLERMGSGRLDPRGRVETWSACRRGEQAVALSLMGPFVCLIFWCGCVRLLLGEFL